jgi:hypothetical protein
MLDECDHDAVRQRRRSRSRRRRSVAGRSISVKRLSKLEVALGRLLFPPERVDRPKTRNECMQGQRPCPFVSCTHHLYLDVSRRTGSIKLNFPDLEVWEMAHSCVLDVAESDGVTFEEVGALMNLSRERVRQVEGAALAKLEALAETTTLRHDDPEGIVERVRLRVLR